MLQSSLSRAYRWLKPCLRASSTLPALTRDRYPNIKRGQYAELQERHVKHFQQLLGEARVITDESECLGYNVDWIKNVRGSSRCVLKPKTTEEVSSILSFCNSECLAVCPQGGNTGLVGGSVPVFDEIVLSTALMNQIISLDDTSGVLVCQAGCILQCLDEYLHEHNLIMPLDLGAKGSCHIGGNVSTNAGGLRLLRYGNLHGNILGIEAVKADGEIIDCLSELKKDNTGYHLKHLFIGSEGTLGFVTKVSVKCPTKSKSCSVALLGLESFENILEVYKRSNVRLGEILSACEMMDEQAFRCTTDNLKLKSPLGSFPFYMLLEIRGSSEVHDEQKFCEFLQEILGDGLVHDVVSTSERSKMGHIWQLRFRIAEGVLHDGYVLKYDISYPLKDFYTIVPVIKKKLGDNIIRCCGYGHIGDGNIHLNISMKEYDKNIVSQIEPFVYEYTSKLKGSISGEHGIGFKKPQFMKFSKSRSSINLMKQIKHLMDPNGILNPYKVKADGEVLDLLSTLKKDNTGYHLKHLFIGSEGTLGIVTKVAIQCPPKSTSFNISVLGVESFENVLKIIKCARNELNEILESLELMDAQSMDMVQTHLKLKNPIGDYPFYMFISTAGSDDKHDGEKINEFLEKCMDNGLILNGTATSEPAKYKDLWAIRERFADSFEHDGYVMIYDLSFPIKDFYRIVPEMNKIVNDKVHRLSGTGHLGDGNIHFQISLKEYDKKTKDYFENIVYNKVKEMNGSISAEHGIGIFKKHVLSYTKPENTIHIMKDIKKLFDPKMILNPYKIFE